MHFESFTFRRSWAANRPGPLVWVLLHYSFACGGTVTCDRWSAAAADPEAPSINRRFLEVEFQGQLPHSGIDGGTTYHAESCGAEVVVRIRKLRVIEDVEELGAKL